MAAFAVVGVTALPGTAVLADNGDNEVDVEVERNNEINQSIEQEQEACTNEAEVEIDDDDKVQIGGGNSVTVGQANVCKVTQSQAAQNNAAIADFSENWIDIDAALADIF